MQITDLTAYVQTHGYRQIENIYKQVFGPGKLNETSTLLLHFPDNGADSSYILEQNFCRPHRLLYADRYCFPATTLMTGDAEIDEEIRSNIHKILTDRYLGVLQIPHHGSQSNWDKLKTFGLYAGCFIIPFGLGNKYRHPGANVIDDLLNYRFNFYCVTQQHGFTYYIC